MRGFAVSVVSDNPGGFDEYGDPVASVDEMRIVRGCLAAPRVKEESAVRGREGVVIDLDLVVPPDAEISRYDRIVIHAPQPTAGLYEVVEPVIDWISKSGVNRGSICSLRKAEG